MVVTKSTVPGRHRTPAASRCSATQRPDLEIDIASNPEFLREGSAIEDFLRPDRVVCGVESERARDVLAQCYRPLNLIETPILFTTLETAELIKYATNSFLATKITFINEVADLCEKVGADVQQVAKGMGMDGRIGSKFLHAGPGYGGSCFPKDTLALLRTGEQHSAPMRIVETVVAVNEGRKRRMTRKIVESCGGNVAGKTIAILGVTFKPNTDDMRDSPSLVIVPALQGEGAAVRAFDPEGMREARKLLPEVDWCTDAYEALEGADALVVLTEWNEFRGLDLGRAHELMRKPLIIDLRNIYRRRPGGARRLQPIPASGAATRRLPSEPTARERCRPIGSTRASCASTICAASSARPSPRPTRGLSAGPSGPWSRRAGGRRVCLGLRRPAELPCPRRRCQRGLAGHRLRGALDRPRRPRRMLYFAAHHLGADGGMQITGSHNPPDYNGIKIDARQPPGLWRGDPGNRCSDRRLRATVETGEGVETTVDVFDAYVDRLVADYHGPRPISVVWDAGNGSAGPAMAALAARLPGRHELPVRRGRRPLPQPSSRPDSAGEPRRPDPHGAGGGYELGIGFDGDGDRIGVVDGQGRIVFGDQILLILAARHADPAAGLRPSSPTSRPARACSTRWRG